jgi:hypothetical protein
MVETFIVAVLFGQLSFNTVEPVVYRHNLCEHVVTNLEIKDPVDSYFVCVDVAKAAAEAGFNPVLVVATAHEESKLREDLVSKVGAIGPLQIIPSYWCPNKNAKGCDLIDAGIHALYEKWNHCTLYNSKNECIRRSRRSWIEALCHYNGGNICYERGRKYARRILRKKRKIEQYLSEA